MAPSLLARARELRLGVDRFLRDRLRKHRLSAICNNGLEPLYTDLSEFVARKGKRIRPLLFLITHRALSGGRDAIPISDLVQVAAALELFHAFILVHDDVIDRSETRRGKPTQNTYFLKTTKYTFECPVVLGAKLAGASEQAALELRRCTHPIGIAFQIQNDLIEFQSRHSRDGSKFFLDDLFEGKKTLLLRHAYDRMGRIDRLFLQTCFDAKRLTDEAIQRIRQLVVQSGAFRDLQRQVDSLFDEAKQSLERSSLSKPQQRGFQDLIKYLYKITLANNGAPQ